MTQSLAQELDALGKFGQLDRDIPEAVTANLAPKIALRPYQRTALQRFGFYMDWAQRQRPAHLLFHMATGSGKTVIMAAAILELYARGHRRFLFFVDSRQIIEKTKANFLDPASSKYLFAAPVRFGGRPVAVREVTNFDEADAESINIHFTTIQGLHGRMRDPRENGVSVEDFAGRDVVLISDEAHHLNAATRGQGELELEASWESTVDAIFRANAGNILLEFTATANLTHPALAAKYRDKLLYDYPLRRFRADRYSKEIELRRADVDVATRMLHAVVLSQFRRKRAGAHGLSLKPVILMKSKNVAPSAENEAAFHRLIAELDGAALLALAARLPGGDTVGDGLRWCLRADGGLSADALAAEVRLDFAPSKVRNVNKPEDLARQQMELNSLEDRDNEVRVIFAVDKLNEGWDVLNLFDIVRLYDVKGTAATTTQEAQLIGRGARYWPFAAPDGPDEPREQRKFDAAEDHPLRIVEQLHYHCSHEPSYLRDIRRALVDSGLLDEDGRKAMVRVKPAFRQSDLFREGLVFANERRRNARGGIFALDDYHVPKLIRLRLGHSGQVSEGGAFGEDERGVAGTAMREEPLTFAALGRAAVRHAMDANPFFHFSSLRRHFPRLVSRDAFVESADFLASVRIVVTGPPTRLHRLVPTDRLRVAQAALSTVEAVIADNSHDHVGTRTFLPRPAGEVITDATIAVGGPFRTRWRDWDGNQGVDLAQADWFAHDDFYGTGEELKVIRLIADNIDVLRARYGDVRLFRNERSVKLYDFDQGRGFEPDFLLFFERDEDGSGAVVQLFAEPKGGHIADADRWKEEFLEAIERQAELPTFVGKTYRVRGLPFANETDWRKSQQFREAVLGYGAPPPDH